MDQKTLPTETTSQTSGEPASPRQRLFPIETQRSIAPWPWLIMMPLPGLVSGYIEFCSNAPLTFTIRKFVNDPALITFLISINTLFNFLVGATAAYMSDRIWTRYGRRRVFLVPGWMGVAFCMALVPMMPTLLPLVVVIVAYQFCQDYGASNLQSLNYEVIPPRQRGRFAMCVTILGSLSGLVNNLIILAQFDSKYSISLFGYHLQFTGEHVTYWYGACLVMVAVLFLAIVVRERKPLAPPPKAEFSFRSVISNAIKPKDFRILLTLCIGVAVAIVGMGTNTTLMLTEQFGYTKKQLGQLQSINLVANVLFLAPLLGYFVDRLPRLRLTMTGIIGMVATHAAFYFYILFFAPGGIPPFWAIAAQSVIHATFGVCYSMSHAPNVFDYITSNRYGTWGSVMTMVSGILLFVLPNLYGLWVKAYSAHFAEPGKFDYTSAYILNMILGSIGIALIFYFRSCVKSGRIVPAGRMERESKPQP